jgi:hypothetical protein
MSSISHMLNDIGPKKWMHLDDPYKCIYLHRPFYLFPYSTIKNILQLLKWRTLVKRGYNRTKLNIHELPKQDSRYIGSTVSVCMRIENLFF